MILVDTSFWISLRDKREQRHAVARQIAQRLVAEQSPLIVTSHIFSETYAYFVRSVILRQVVVRDFWENPVVRIEPVTTQDEHRALKLIRLHEDKTYSFCDALSFTVMERLKIRRAVSFDDHFRQYGGCEVISK